MEIYSNETTNCFENQQKHKQNKKKLEEIFEKTMAGDCIECTDLDGIVKSAKQLCELVNILADKKCKLMAGDIAIDCRDISNPETIGMINMAKLFEQLEHNVFRQSVKTGVDKAKKNGKIVGRPSLRVEDIPKQVIENYDLLEQGELNKSDYAKLCNISRPTLNKYLEIMKTDR